MMFRDLYQGAHLFVAGIRVHEHLHGRPPTLAGLAQILKVSEEDVISAIQDGSLKARKLGSAYRISKEALEEFLKG